MQNIAGAGLLRYQRRPAFVKNSAWIEQLVASWKNPSSLRAEAQFVAATSRLEFLHMLLV